MPRQARVQTDQGLPKPEASDLTNPGVRMAARGPALVLAEASPSWRQGGATLGPSDARGVTPGMHHRPTRPAPFALRRCIALRPFARSVRLLRHLALCVEHADQLRRLEQQSASAVAPSAASGCSAAR